MIPFARMHGSGNDFVVVDDRAGRLRPHRQALAQALCDRRRGLGGDGLVLLSNGTQGHVVMSYINADGMDGEMCGNGAGCAVRRAWELGLFTGSETVLDTDAGAVGARLDGYRVTMRMTDPQDERLHLSIPTSEGTLVGHYIDTGVPHVVLFVDDVAQANLAELGPEIRRHALFPRGCNVNWASKIAENSFRMRTYERGVEAETLSCGTGATAIALIAYRLGLARPPVKVRASGGGTLSIEFDETAASPLRNVRTTVEVERIAEGTLDADWLARRGFTLLSKDRRAQRSLPAHLLLVQGVAPLEVARMEESMSNLAARAERASPTQSITALDWTRIAHELDEHGCAIVGPLLSADTCAQLIESYDDEARFRSTIVMARHGFGQGEYKYFTAPLPGTVVALRTAFYPPLAEIANRWNEKLGVSQRFPAELDAYLARCHKAGQTRPTPLLLKYAAGDYNCLHQDLYGEHVFPLQLAILLSDPGRDFTGGEFVLTEHRPRRQSRVEVVPLHRSEGVIFPVHHRLVCGTRGTYRVTMRHGVSRLRSGHRMTLGIIFHDAK